MGVRRLAALAAVAQLVLLATCSNAAASAACPTDLRPPVLESSYDAAMALVCDVNVMRARHSLRPLRWDWRLWSGAQTLASDMAARHYASHVTPEGLGVADRLQPTGYMRRHRGWFVAENLAWGTSSLSTPLAVVLGWMDSDLHRKNLLDPMLRDIGVGTAQGAITIGGESGSIFVADFGTRGDSVKRHVRSRRARRR